MFTPNTKYLKVMLIGCAHLTSPHLKKVLGLKLRGIGKNCNVVIKVNYKNANVLTWVIVNIALNHDQRKS